jgi:putative intracellular protease/amidase
VRQAVVMSLKILIVLTSHAALGGTGKPTGYYLPELTHALQVFEAAGLQVDLASPKGGEPPMDGADRKDPINARYLDDTAFRARLKTTRSLDQVRAPGLRRHLCAGWGTARCGICRTMSACSA